MNVQEFKERFPELSSGKTDEELLASLNRATFLLPYIAEFGELREEALGYLTAHMIHLDKVGTVTRGEAVSTKTSAKVGGVNFTYKTESGNREWYATSNWGQQFLMLLDLLPTQTGAFVV